MELFPRHDVPKMGAHHRSGRKLRMQKWARPTI